MIGVTSQHLVTVIIVVCMWLTRVVTFDTITRATLYRWLPLNVLFVGMLLTNLVACVSMRFVVAHILQPKIYLDPNGYGF